MTSQAPRSSRWFYGWRSDQDGAVFEDWPACHAAAKGCPRSVYKKFRSEEEALDFAFLDPSGAAAYRVRRAAELETPDPRDARDADSAQPPSAAVVVVPDTRASLHCWIGSCDKGRGSISVWFGSADPRNYAGPFQYGGVVKNTRLGLAAFARAVSIVVRHNRATPDGACQVLYVHCRTRYLRDAVHRLLPSGTRRKGRTAPAALLADHADNGDLHRALANQLASLGGTLEVTAVLDAPYGTSLEDRAQADHIAAEHELLSRSTNDVFGRSTGLGHECSTDAAQ